MDLCRASPWTGAFPPELAAFQLFPEQMVNVGVMASFCSAFLVVTVTVSLAFRAPPPSNAAAATAACLVATRLRSTALRVYVRLWTRVCRYISRLSARSATARITFLSRLPCSSLDELACNRSPFSEAKASLRRRHRRRPRMQINIPGPGRARNCAQLIELGRQFHFWPLLLTSAPFHDIGKFSLSLRSTFAWYSDGCYCYYYSTMIVSLSFRLLCAVVVVLVVSFFIYLTNKPRENAPLDCLG